MYNKEKPSLKFVQIYAAAVSVERPALSLSLRFVNLSWLYLAVSAARRALSRSLVRRIALLQVVTHLCSLQVAKQLKTEQITLILSVCGARTHAIDVRTIHTYIRKLPPFNSLVRASLTLASMNT